MTSKTRTAHAAATERSGHHPASPDAATTTASPGATAASTPPTDRQAEYRALMRFVVALAMSFSSVTVISNANRLTRFRLQEVTA